jgi:hypothetical protein
MGASQSMKCVPGVLEHEEPGDQSLAHLEHHHELTPGLQPGGGDEALPAHHQHLVPRRQALGPPEGDDAAQGLEVFGDVAASPLQAAELRLRGDHPELDVVVHQREEGLRLLRQEPVHGLLHRVEVGGRGIGHGLR